MPADKIEIRRTMKRLEREFLSAGRDVAETEAIWKKVEESEAFRKAATVLIYMAIDGEVPTESFIGKWNGVKRFVIPRVCGEELALYEYDPAHLIPGYKGISEPAEDAVEVQPESIDLALVPGIAFTKEGGRLGRGKGFYDRLIPRLNCPCAGIGFSFRWIESLPLDNWDAKLSTDLSVNP